MPRSCKASRYPSLKPLLVRGQGIGQGIIDKIKLKSACAIAHAVEHSQNGNACIKHALAPLPVDIFPQVAGKGCHKLYLISFVEFKKAAYSARASTVRLVRTVTCTASVESR